MTNQLVKQQPEERAIEFLPFGSDDKIKLTVKMVQDFICIPTKSGKVCSDKEAMKFAMLCKARGLNPWEGDAYLQGYDGKDGPQFSLITAHNAFLKRAELHPEYDGMESGVVVRNAEGEVKDREGDWFDDQIEEVVGAWARVNFKTRKHSMYKRLRMSTFNKGYGVWEKNPEGMIVKCAEADALRSAFPTKMGGMYLAGELTPGSDEAFRAAKPASGNVIATAGLLPEATEPLRCTPLPEPEAKPSPHLQMASLLTENGHTAADFLAWAKHGGHCADTIEEFEQVSDDTVKRLLRAKTGMLKGISEMKEAKL